jgi:adenylyltransferase/sulfurtransferase
MAWSEEQLARYSRHILLPEVGGKGQRKIAQARVLIIGAGGLGAPVALYLAAAGVGTLGLVDADDVDLSNLHRQVIHQTPDIGRPKVESAKEKIVALNPDVQVICYRERLDADNALALFTSFDCIIDGTDNFPAKFVINDAAYFTGKPLIHGGILRFDGQLFTIRPGLSACYRCLFPEPPPAGLVPSCQEAGVIGTLAGVIGTLQATEALKLILNIGRPLTDRILKYDALRSTFRIVRIRKNPLCSLCGESPTITTLLAQEAPVCEMPSPVPVTV